MTEIFERLANNYCSLVESASSMGRNEFLVKVYKSLPHIIGAATELPDVEVESESSSPQKPVTHQRWSDLYNLLKEKFEDWDSYRKIFDPTTDDEAIFGSLSNDVADIYSDLKNGLALTADQPQNAVFHWRLLFYSHWGKHAIDALEVIHCRMSESLMDNDS